MNYFSNVFGVTNFVLSHLSSHSPVSLGESVEPGKVVCVFVSFGPTETQSAESSRDKLNNLSQII